MQIKQKRNENKKCKELKKEDYSPEKLSAAMQKRAGDFLSTVLVRIVSVSGKKER